MQSIDNKELKINLDVLLVGLNIHKQNPTQYTLKKILVCLCKSMISAKNEEDFEYIKSFLEESRKYEYVSDKCLNLLINFSQPNNLNQAKELLIYRENEKRKEKELLSKRENEKSKVKAFIKEYDEINKEFDILDDRLHQLDDFKNLCRRLVNLEDSLDEFELNLDEAKRYEGILEDKLHFLLQIINKIILFFSSTSFAISSKICSCFSFLLSILIISPHNKSFTLILSSLHKSSIIDESGIAFPFSHFDIALSVMFNFSASCI